MNDAAMKAQYAQTAASLGRLGDVGATAVEQPALHALCDMLEQQLGALMEGVRRTQQFSHRLLDPRPANVSKEPNQVSPAATSIESRLRGIVRAAEMINGELHNVAADLERAA